MGQSRGRAGRQPYQCHPPTAVALQVPLCQLWGDGSAGPRHSCSSVPWDTEEVPSIPTARDVGCPGGGRAQHGTKTLHSLSCVGSEKSLSDSCLLTLEPTNCKRGTQHPFALLITAGAESGVYPLLFLPSSTPFHGYQHSKEYRSLPRLHVAPWAGPVLLRVGARACSGHDQSCVALLGSSEI